MQRLRFCNGMSVEDVQNQVEVALMAEHHYEVAKAFMLYRKRHEDDRETADKLRFLINYCNSTNPATGSKYYALRRLRYARVLDVHEPLLRDRIRHWLLRTRW